jgi:glc operon protein GlcG
MRSKPCLTSADGHKMMAACKAEAEKNNWNVSIAIVDDAGALLLLERMDGAGSTTPEVAHGKARTAALTKQPTKVWEERVTRLLEFPRRARDLGRGSNHVSE